MSQPPQASKRRGGRGVLVQALLILAVIGVVALWLGCPGAVYPRFSATPYVELELPPPPSDQARRKRAAAEPASPEAPDKGAEPAPEAATPSTAAPPTVVADASRKADDQAATQEARPGPASPPAAASAPEPEEASPSVTGAATAPATAMEPPPAPEPPALEAPSPAPSSAPPATQGPVPTADATVPREEPVTETPVREAPIAEAPAAAPPAAEARAPEPPTQTPAPEARPVAPHSPQAIDPEMAADGVPADEPATSPQLAAAGIPGAVPLPPLHRFARPFPAEDPRPRIAIIVAELGLGEAATTTAIDRLPAAVTLSFNPYSRGLQAWIDAARADGHEVMLDLPMEPVSYPLDDPGPKALFTALSEAENQARLKWALDRAEGYVGVVPWMGSRFSTSAEDLRPVLAHVDERGLMFVDARPSPDSIAARLADEMGVPRAINTRFLDHVPSREAIESRLRQIEREARTTGFAVGMASPYPITIDILDRWVRTLDRKGLVLAPISALAGQQVDP